MCSLGKAKTLLFFFNLIYLFLANTAKIPGTHQDPTGISPRWPVFRGQEKNSPPESRQESCQEQNIGSVPGEKLTSRREKIIA